MKRLLCLFGHRWKNYGVNRAKQINLCHLHDMAGTLQMCTRCGKVWDDLFFYPEDQNCKVEYRKFVREMMYRDARLLNLKTRET